MEEDDIWNDAYERLDDNITDEVRREATLRTAEEYKLPYRIICYLCPNALGVGVIKKDDDDSDEDDDNGSDDGSKDVRKAYSYNDQAGDYFNAGNYSEALKLYAQALQCCPLDGEIAVKSKDIKFYPLLLNNRANTYRK